VRVVGTSPDAARALMDSPRLAPDVVLVDMATPGASTLVHQLTAASRGPKVVGLMVSEPGDEIINWIAAGISGYVASDATLDDLLTTILRVQRGEIWPPQITAALTRHVRSWNVTSPPIARLTSREREIFYFVDHGRSNKEIAQQLHISLATVKNHIHHVLKKLRVRKRGDVAACIRPRDNGLRPGEPSQLR
jgi:two-component system, NarL family, nitrate/nitrite response regulator NarL